MVERNNPACCRPQQAKPSPLSVLCSCQAKPRTDGSSVPQQLRPHRYFGRTVSVCPECKRPIGAKLVERDGKAYLDKHCPEHGAFLCLVSTCFEDYLGVRAPMIHGRLPQEFSTETKDGCPLDCGYCPQHEQHACIGLIEITDRCDLHCPICYANRAITDDISPSDFARRLDTLQRVEGNLDIVQISGGEPTLHPQLFDLLRETRRRQPTRILLNTNGRRIANDPAFVAGLAEFNDVLDVYLQYDGPSAAAGQRLRGADVREEKEQALAHLAAKQLNTILVATVCPENLADVPEILQFAAKTPIVTGVTFQALAFFGRAERGDSSQRVTSSDIVDALTSVAWLQRSDIFPLPCSHPYCTQIGYLHCRSGRDPFPLIRLANHHDVAPVLQNRLSYDSSMYRQLLPALKCIARGRRLNLRNLRGAWAARRFFRNATKAHWRGEKLLRVIVKQFMDPETFDASRATRCCIAVVTDDDRMIPFCSYNTIHRAAEPPAKRCYRTQPGTRSR